MKSAIKRAHAILGLLMVVFLAIAVGAYYHIGRDAVEGLEGHAAPPPPSNPRSSFGKLGDTVQLIYAAWCGHCKELMQPGGVWETVKSRMAAVNFVELDEAKNAAAVAKFSPQGFPDIRITAGGESVAQYTGSRDVDSIMSWIADHIVSNQ